MVCFPQCMPNLQGLSWCNKSTGGHCCLDIRTHHYLDRFVHRDFVDRRHGKRQGCCIKQDGYHWGEARSSRWEEIDDLYCFIGGTWKHITDLGGFLYLFRFSLAFPEACLHKASILYGHRFRGKFFTFQVQQFSCSCFLMLSLSILLSKRNGCCLHNNLRLLVSTAIYSMSRVMSFISNLISNLLKYIVELWGVIQRNEFLRY